MAEHTPGPWNVCERVAPLQDGKHLTAEQLEYMWYVGKRPGVAIALVDGSLELSGEADARLICAAPELLEACERLENALAFALAGKPVRDADEIIVRAQKAIAKARNSSPIKP